MSTWGTVVLPCRKCEKTITRPAKKKGQLFSCSSCGKVQRTPGIATQPQATEAQLEFIERARRAHLRAIVVALSMTVAFIPLAMLLSIISLGLGLPEDQEVAVAVGLPYLLFLASMIFLLFSEVRSMECLGRNMSTSFVLFLVLWPVWIVRSVIALFQMRSALRRLKAVGPRS